MARCGLALSVMLNTLACLPCCRTAENHIYNLLHRGYTSEPGGHATCPFECVRRGGVCMSGGREAGGQGGQEKEVCLQPATASWAVHENA